MFQDFPEEIYELLASEPVSSHFHSWSLSMQVISYQLWSKTSIRRVGYKKCKSIKNIKCKVKITYEAKKNLKSLKGGVGAINGHKKAWQSIYHNTIYSIIMVYLPIKTDLWHRFDIILSVQNLAPLYIVSGLVSEKAGRCRIVSWICMQ